MTEEKQNEFENLFQRAAENYPLNTDSANWNAVLEKLEKESDQKGLILKKRAFYLIVLLFVSLLSAFLMNRYMNWNEKNKGFVVPTLNEKEQTEQNMVKKITDAVYDKVIDSIKQENELKEKNTVPTLNNLAKTKIASANVIVASQPFLNATNSTVLSPQNNKTTGVIKTPTITAATNKTSSSSEPEIQETKKALEKNTELAEVVASTKAMTNVNSPDSSSASNHSSPAIIIKKAAFKKYFYTGMLYATDKSSINFEASKGQGHSIAFLLGYQFSKRFSIETGIHIEKKEYYTKGEHFDKSILPATGKILWIESENKLIEIPLSLKTNLFEHKKHQLFGSLGISSFLVNNETYEYEEELNGVIQSETVEFTKNSSNLFATANMSIGYEYKIKNKFRLRVEPYLNLPLSGIGKGKEPVLSKGVYFGLIYNFHKN